MKTNNLKVIATTFAECRKNVVSAVSKNIFAVCRQTRAMLTENNEDYCEAFAHSDMVAAIIKPRLQGVKSAKERRDLNMIRPTDCLQDNLGRYCVLTMTGTTADVDAKAVALHNAELKQKTAYGPLVNLVELKATYERQLADYDSNLTLVQNALKAAIAHQNKELAKAQRVRINDIKAAIVAKNEQLDKMSDSMRESVANYEDASAAVRSAQAKLSNARKAAKNNAVIRFQDTEFVMLPLATYNLNNVLLSADNRYTISDNYSIVTEATADVSTK